MRNDKQIRRWWTGVLILGIATLATVTSSLVPGVVRIAYPGSLDCAQACDFVAAGWPFAYLVDHHGLSPVGSVSLLGGLFGIDIVRVDRLIATAVFWWLVSAVLVRTAFRLARVDRAA